jgi:hypothetical protein
MSDGGGRTRGKAQDDDDDDVGREQQVSLSCFRDLTFVFDDELQQRTAAERRVLTGELTQLEGHVYQNRALLPSTTTSSTISSSASSSTSSPIVAVVCSRARFEVLAGQGGQVTGRWWNGSETV